MEFTVSNDLNGQVVPRGINLGQRGSEFNYLKDNDFLTNEDDRNEIKFHIGNNLTFVALHMGGHRYTVAEWNGFRE